MSEYLFALRDRKEVALETFACWFDTLGSDFSFIAGQYAAFTLLDPPQTDAEGNARPFSIASSPHHKDFILITFRMRDTAFKKCLTKMPLGTKVLVKKPKGAFVLHSDSARPAVFLAGGIGVTPMRSIIEWTAQEKLAHKIYLFYSNRTPAYAAFLNDFEEWEKQNTNFKLIPTITDVKDPSWKGEFGMIDEKMLKKYLPDIHAPIYYIAGPPSMVEGMKQTLLKTGIRNENIKTEKFSGY